MKDYSKKKHLKQLQFIERGVGLRMIDLIITICSVVLVSHFFKFDYFSAFESNLWVWILTYSFYFLMFGEVFELYHLSKTYDFYFSVRSIFLTTIFTTIAYIFTPVITPILPNSRIEIMIFFQAIIWPLIIWRGIYSQFLFRPLFLKNTLIIGKNDEVENTINTILAHSKEYKTVGYISPTAVINISDEIQWFSIPQHHLESIIKENDISIIIMSSNSLKELPIILSSEILKLYKKGVMVISVTDFLEHITRRISTTRLNASFYEHFTYSRYNKDTLYLSLIRVFDIFTSLIGLSVFLGLIPIIWGINLILNKGTFFYKQQRVGKNGVHYTIYKLRTMVQDAEKGEPLWAKKDDIRATPFGRFLRKTRVDEIPQFYNVLKGEMSIIGPRPERPEFVKLLEDKLPFYAIRHIINPGLTGWAQVEYPYANTIEDQEMKLRYDLYYIKERSLLLDIKIILKTINTILFYKGY
jgi:exopolysaccharide biosynthesis polyprenyl glycosylphosphotransferase